MLPFGQEFFCRRHLLRGHCNISTDKQKTALLAFKMQIMLDKILLGLGLFLIIVAGGIFYHLYHSRTQRVLGIRDGKQQGIKLITWFTFLGLFINVLFPWLVNWDPDQYPFVVLPLLLTMVATMLWILYPIKGPDEEADY